MQRAGQLKKLHGRVDMQGNVSYSLELGSEFIELNPFVGKHIRLEHNGIIHCIACNRPIKKSFQQGYCFPCTQTLAQCDICIVRPELCHYRHGTCREPGWGEQHCMQSHYVYLANASGIKVGITRGSNIPMRWIDQGASQALPIIEVKDRYVSGLVEVLFKKHIADKTNWRKMLQGEPESVDLAALRDELFLKLESDFIELEAKFDHKVIEYLPKSNSLHFSYPVSQYPTTIKKAEFNTEGILEAKLLGIKGQYWILDTGVMNIRNIVGQHISLQCESNEMETVK